MDPLPPARLIPHEPMARTRAAAAHAGRALRRAWARIARQVLLLGLTAIGFAGVLAMTFVLAQAAITVHPVLDPPIERPMVIYFMHQPSVRPVRAAMATLGATEGEVASQAVSAAPR
jgi:hypothetical protein